MANSLITTDMVTREALRVAHESASFLGTIDRSHDDSFAKGGAKIGSALRVRKPNQFTRRAGSRVMDVQDQDESNGTITVATQDGVDMRFNSAELALSIDDFSKRYIEPAVKVLVSNIEADVLAYATKATYQEVGQGTAGAIGTALTTLAAPGYARARLNKQLAPMGDRAFQLDSMTMASLVSGSSAYFNPGSDLSKQYREGLIARTAMADYYENERVWTMTTGDDLAATVDESAATNFVEGSTTLHIDAIGTTLYVGQTFTIAGIYDCHPETKQPYAHLKQFVLTATPTIAGNEADINFSPAIYTTGAKKNVSTSTGADLTWTYTEFDGDAVTFAGTASKTYVTGLMYHKEAFQFVSADLPIMDDAHKCVRRVQDGLSMRVWQGSDIRNDELLMRIDILYGMAALRPEWACRVVGASTT